MKKEGRICDICNHFNTNTELAYCEDCGGDLSYLPVIINDSDRIEGEADAVTTPSDNEPNIESELARTVRMKGICLVNTASGYEVQIPLEGAVIGRSGTVNSDHFQNSRFVSGRHAQISLSATGYTITDLDSTNGTKLNGQRLMADRNYPIQENDKIVFANLEYVVKAL